MHRTSMEEIGCVTITTFQNQHYKHLYLLQTIPLGTPAVGSPTSNLQPPTLRVLTTGERWELESGVWSHPAEEDKTPTRSTASRGRGKKKIHTHGEKTKADVNWKSIQARLDRHSLPLPDVQRSLHPWHAGDSVSGRPANIILGSLFPSGILPVSGDSRVASSF
ncbi:hypothetical protein BJX76DRAFT_265460 [Aspergillus varians]